jgi:16S rRNA processing protein RimM
MERTAGSTSSIEPERVTLGQVVGAHGLRGELRVRLLDETDNNLRAMSSVWLAREEGDPKAVEARVRAVGSGRRGEARLALEGVDGREAAEALRGRLVQADMDRLAPLAAGEYYQYQLIGCRVEHGDGRVLGVVSGIWETGAPAVLVVVDETRREHLIPAVSAILREVDVVARRITIDAPPGLISKEADEVSRRAARRSRAKTHRVDR